MNLIKKILPLLWLPFISITNPCCAQKIDLANVRVIMLIAQTGGFSTDYFLRLDIKRENGQWNCYKKQQFNAFDQKTHQRVNDTVVKLIKVVSNRTLKKLVRLINEQDSAIDLRLFKIDKKVLLKDIDSMTSNSGPKFFELDSVQHKQFEDMVQSKSVVAAAAIEALHPRRFSDEDHYSLRFITRTDTILAEAVSFVYPYYLPWHIGKKVSYDPRITIMFEDLRNNPNFRKKQWASFQMEIDQRIWFDYFSKHNKHLKQFKKS